MTDTGTTDAIGYYLSRLAEALPVKVAIAVALAVAASLDAAWARVPVLYQQVIVWCLLDLLTGLVKAYELKANNSKAGKEGALKLVVYLGLLAISDYAARSYGVLGDALSIPIIGDLLVLITKNLPYLSFGLILHTELTSVVENVRAVTHSRGYTMRPLELLAAILGMEDRKLEQKIKEVLENGADQQATGPLAAEVLGEGDGLAERRQGGV